MNNPNSVIKWGFIIGGGILGGLVVGLTGYYFEISWLPVATFLIFLICYSSFGAYILSKIENEACKWSTLILLFRSYEIQVSRQCFLLGVFPEIKQWLIDNAEGNCQLSRKRYSIMFQKESDMFAFKIAFGEYCDA